MFKDCLNHLQLFFGEELAVWQVELVFKKAGINLATIEVRVGNNNVYDGNT